MTTSACSYDFQFDSLDQITRLLHHHQIEYALFKVLAKNDNDKNQVRIASDFKVLHPTFAMTFNERGESTSQTKSKSSPGKRIPEAIFNDFKWLRNDGSSIPAKNVKAIIYAQYPEARLSGFKAIDNTMPRGLSIAYSKAANIPPRLLILGATPYGGTIGIFCCFPRASLVAEVMALEGAYRSKVTKQLRLQSHRTTKLVRLLSDVVSQTHDGCRLDKNGVKVPFNGTQVCGYTLEQACGITPNANKDGDIFGIELKAHTQPKVSLVTTEPDFGCYADSFANFMTTYGYQDRNGNWRLTGTHRANIRCKKSGLTLKIRVSRYDDAMDRLNWHDFNPLQSLTSQMDSVEVVLLDDHGRVAAGWSLERLMNSWNIKHNEVVYVTANKFTHTNAEKLAAGYRYQVTFKDIVMWCHNTSLESLLIAIHHGVVYLDPAPKYVPTNVNDNKRRSQWRVLNIAKAAPMLYEKVQIVVLPHQ